MKYKADENIQRYKTWLVIKGFTQTYGINYAETFALKHHGVLLPLAANLEKSLQQLDIKYTFLNGNLEEVYLILQPDFCKKRWRKLGIWIEKITSQSQTITNVHWTSWVFHGDNAWRSQWTASEKILVNYMCWRLSNGNGKKCFEAQSGRSRWQLS